MSVKNRTAILDAAFEVLARNPAAKLSEVAAAAGVGRATLHRHFASREDLIEALALTAVRDLDEAVDTATVDAKSHLDALRLCLMAIVPLADRQYILALENLDRFPAVAKEFQRQRRELDAEIEMIKQEGGFERHMPTAWISSAFDNLTFMAWTMVQDGEATPRQAADFAWRLLRSGLAGEDK